MSYYNDLIYQYKCIYFIYKPQIVKCFFKYHFYFVHESEYQCPSKLNYVCMRIADDLIHVLIPNDSSAWIRLITHIIHALTPFKNAEKLKLRQKWLLKVEEWKIKYWRKTAKVRFICYPPQIDVYILKKVIFLKESALFFHKMNLLLQVTLSTYLLYLI